MNKRRNKRPKQITKPEVTWAQAARDVLIASMNRGQLPILGIIGIVFLVVWKMPNEEASRLAFDLVEKLSNLEMWAYILLVITLVGWYLHARLMRKEFSNEYRRIGREKSELQRKLAGIKYQSSDES